MESLFQNNEIENISKATLPQNNTLIFIIIGILILILIFFIYKFYTEKNEQIEKNKNLSQKLENNDITILRQQNDYQDLMNKIDISTKEKISMINKIEKSINNTVDELDTLLNKEKLTQDDELLLNNLNITLVSLILMAKSIDSVYFGNINDPTTSQTSFLKRIITSFSIDTSKLERLNKLKKTIERAEEKLIETMALDDRSNSIIKLISIFFKHYLQVNFCYENRIISTYKCKEQEKIKFITDPVSNAGYILKPQPYDIIIDEMVPISENEPTIKRKYIYNGENIFLDMIKSIYIPKNNYFEIEYTNPNNQDEMQSFFSFSSTENDKIFDLDLDVEFKNKFLNARRININSMIRPECSMIRNNKDEIKEKLETFFKNEIDNYMFFNSVSDLNTAKKLTIEKSLNEMLIYLEENYKILNNLNSQDILLINYIGSSFFNNCKYENGSWICPDNVEINYENLVNFFMRLGNYCDYNYDSPQINNVSREIYKNIEI